jgi:hypothetical protein
MERRVRRGGREEPEPSVCLGWLRRDADIWF